MQTIHLKGETHKRFWISEYSQIPVPLAPLNEQKRILAKLEKLLADLDKGIEYLETTKQQLKVYRQAVLKWAFEGKLTNRDVKDGELPNGWDSKKISQVADTFGGYAFKSGEFESKGKFQVIRMGNVRPGILRLDESPVFISKLEEKALSKAILKVNDIIVTQTGTKGKRDYGFTALISKDNLLLNQRIAAIRCNEDCVPKFLLYYTWTNKFKDQFFANETGNVGQGNVGMKAVTDTIIWIPKPAEQIKVVSEIESRLSVCDKIEETIESSLQQAEALRLSIIKKAFEGKLVPQDPNDEPAEKLLERIRALRQAQGKQGKAKPEKKEKGQIEKNVKTKSKLIKEKV
jgi:type I restriction enzyme S subunit